MLRKVESAKKQTLRISGKVSESFHVVKIERKVCNAIFSLAEINLLISTLFDQCLRQKSSGNCKNG